jgi:hypothetical protein
VPVVRSGIARRPRGLRTAQSRPRRPLRGLEREIGHRFRADLAMADIIAEARGDTAQLALLPLADIA